MQNSKDATLRRSLPVGDRRRSRCGRAALSSLAIAIVTLLFLYLSKEIGQLYVRTPWQDDPYDAVVSFALFFLPLVIGVTGTRLLACRRFEPLPLTRIVGMMRGCQVALAACGITLLSDWISVALRSNSVEWNQITAVIVGAVLVLSIATVVAGVQVYRSARTLPWVSGPDMGPDFFADLLVNTDVLSRRLGPFRRMGLSMVDWFDRIIVYWVRQRPVIATGLLSLIFGLVLSAGRILGEGAGPGLVALVFMWVAVSGMFAFVLAAGSYLCLLRPLTHARGLRRRLIDASVAASASVPVALAFRNSLWWVVAEPGTATASSLVHLLVVVEIVAFVGVFGVEMVFRVHQQA